MIDVDNRLIRKMTVIRIDMFSQVDLLRIRNVMTWLMMRVRHIVIVHDGPMLRDGRIVNVRMLVDEGLLLHELPWLHNVPWPSTKLMFFVINPILMVVTAGSLEFLAYTAADASNDQ